MTTPPTGTPSGRPASPRRDQLLTDLAAEIRAARTDQQRDAAALRAELARFEELLSENATLLGQALPRITDLEGEVSGLTGRVDELAAAKLKTDKPPKITPADWPALDAEAAHREWDALGQWVAEVLCPIYQPSRSDLPDCWPRHPRAVVELVWLRHAYVAAHEPDAAATASAEWHVRWRSAAIINVGDAISNQWCRPSEHLIDRTESDRRRRAVVDAAREQAQARAEAEARTAQQHPPQHVLQNFIAPPDPRVPDEPQVVGNWLPHWREAVAAELRERRERDAARAAAAESADDDG